MEKRAVGRPNTGGRVKRRALNMKTTEELRDKLEASAKSMGLALTQEVERRLRLSLEQDDRLGGDISLLVDLLTVTVRTIERRNGKTWLEDPRTFEEVEAATRRLLAWNRPREADAFNVAVAEASRRWSEAADANAAAVKALDDYRISLGVASTNGFEPVSLFFPAPTPGIFGGAARPNFPPDPRADWTDDQRKEEARLQAEVQATDTARRETNETFSAIYARVTSRREEAKAAGEAAASEMFSLHGPKAKP